MKIYKSGHNLYFIHVRIVTVQTHFQHSINVLRPGNAKQQIHGSHDRNQYFFRQNRLAWTFDLGRNRNKTISRPLTSLIIASANKNNHYNRVLRSVWNARWMRPLAVALSFSLQSAIVPLRKYSEQN